MLTNKTKVLLILTEDVLDRARVLAGKATTTLKLPVSLQIVLRALIEVGLKRDNHPALLANVEGQAKAVRHQRTVAGRARQLTHGGQSLLRPAGRGDPYTGPVRGD
jgi:DNA-directed RNA polymerase subunit K/omega